jgi:hypothetical protein
MIVSNTMTMLLSPTRERSARMLILIGVFLLACDSVGAQTPNPIQLDAQPSTIPHDTPTTVTVTARVAPSASAVLNVTLNRYDVQDRVIGTLGSMYDDGTHGDAQAGDRLFTTQVAIRQPGPADFNIRASVAYRGQLLRVLSQRQRLTITVQQTLEAARATLGSALRDGRRADAYAMMGDRLNGRHLLDALPPSDLMAIGNALENCSSIQSTNNYALCTSPLVLSSGAVTFNFVLVKDAYGAWRLLAW